MLLYVLGLLAASQLVPNFRPSHLFARGPQTEQLAKAEADLAKAKADAAKADADYHAALEKKDADTKAQVQYSQQMVAGIPPALARAPQGPEVKLALSLANRAAVGLTAAIGELPIAKQTEIFLIVEQALSAKQDELNAANTKLAQLDAELKITTQQKLAVEAQLPVLREKAEKLEAKVETATALVGLKTADVVKYAEKAAEREKEAGSLSATLTKAAYLAGFLIFLYGFVHFGLPSLAQEFPGTVWLTRLNQATKSLSSAHA